MQFDIDVAGESAVVLRFKSEPSESLTRHLVALQTQFKERHHEWLVDTLISYNSLFIQYNWEKVDHFFVLNWVRNTLKNVETKLDSATRSAQVTIPVWYDTENNFDFLSVCETCDITPQALIDIHCSSTYTAYAIGFSPGFAFLGQLDARLHVPRKSTPRSLVPKGAVAIAHTQLAVYPESTPGGWNIIGRCPLELRTTSSNCQTRINIGYKVRFTPISKAQFMTMLEYAYEH